MKKCFAAFAILVLTLAACGQPSSQVLPTLFPTPGGDVSPIETQAQPTAQPTNEPLARPTLPPTWTPDAAQLSASGIPTPTPETLNTPRPLPTLLPTLAVCGTFLVDRQNSMSTFKIGTTPQVFWSKVETAFRYRVRLLDDTAAEVFVDFALEPSYIFRADLFQKDKVYAWSVYPEDSLGQQMCLEQGVELYPQ